MALAFSAANHGFTPVDAIEILTGLKVDGAETLCSGGESGRANLRLWPHLHGTDGFFASVWLKK